MKHESITRATKRAMLPGYLTSTLLGCFVILALSFLRPVTGHGRLVEPPSRASMWRYGYNTPPNYHDNEQNCGGFATHWESNNGSCGVCGDAWNSKREHEIGGKYASAIVVRRYQPAGLLLVIVELTANHRGHMEFRICPVTEPAREVTWDCLNHHVLQLADGSGTRYRVDEYGPGKYQLLLRLPADLECSRCVLQWQYHTGNSWGSDNLGNECLGCGPQEQFYGCSDIAIGNQIQHEESQLHIHGEQSQASLVNDGETAIATSGAWRHSSVKDDPMELESLSHEVYAGKPMQIKTKNLKNQQSRKKNQTKLKSPHRVETASPVSEFDVVELERDAVYVIPKWIVVKDKRTKKFRLIKPSPKSASRQIIPAKDMSRLLRMQQSNKWPAAAHDVEASAPTDDISKPEDQPASHQLGDIAEPAGETKNSGDTTTGWTAADDVTRGWIATDDVTIGWAPTDVTIGWVTTEPAMTWVKTIPAASTTNLPPPRIVPTADSHNALHKLLYLKYYEKT